MLGNLLLIVAIFAILHAAYSTYEHLSYLKALGRPEGSIPHDIVIEAFIALALGTIGATIRMPELREITWRSEMKLRAQDELDPRLSFKLFAQRAGISSADTPSTKEIDS